MKLVRGLGIFSVISIACGAMLAGLLVLPAYAAQFTGPSVFFAFLLAGILFIPATLSKAEMATAIPEAGGDYLFVDRALGPLFSTITGIGMYLTFTLKTAFALAGMSAYLLFVVTFDPAYTEIIAAVVAALLVLVNYRGVEESGKLQIILFFVVLAFLTVFVGRGSLEVVRDHFQPFFTEGWNGFFTATAFVFVSYAGVTKIASVAGEIKNPGEVIPAGMLISLGGMMLFYFGVVYVLVGMVPIEELLVKKYKQAPLAVLGENVGGYYGQILISGVSVVALISMANAGLLASSRYPFALSKHDQLPTVLSKIHPSFSTPTTSILLTGVILVLFILFLPVVQLAKLASTFKLIVLGLLNVSLIVFRESDIEWYRPEFYSPLYPYVQIAGVLASIMLIGFLGLVPLIVSLGLIGGGACWFYCYVRGRVDREGAIFKTVPREMDEQVEVYEEFNRRASSEQRSVVVPFFELEEDDILFMERRIRLASALCGGDERLDIVHFFEVPNRAYLSEFDVDHALVEKIDERIDMLKRELDVDLQFDQILTSHTRGALRSYVESEKPHWLVYRWITPSPWKFLLGKTRWWLEDFPCNIVFFNDNGAVTFEDILVITEPGPYDGEVVCAADHVAQNYGGEVTFLNPVASSEKAQSFVTSYQQELRKLSESPTSVSAIEADRWVEEVVKRTEDADLLVMGGLTDETFPGFPGKELGEEIAEDASCSVIRVRSNLMSPKSVMPSRTSRGIEPDTDLLLQHPYERIEVTSKQRLFQRIAEDFSSENQDSGEFLKALWDRERLKNTYMTGGVAFPHCMLEELEDTRLKVYLLESPVTYTDDDREVEVCVVTAGPPGDRQVHLEIIGEMARALVNSDFKTRLKNHPDPSDFLRDVIDFQ